MRSAPTIDATWKRWRIAALLVACAVLAGPAAAQSNSNDAAYCAQLAGMVQRYVGSTGSGTSVMPNPTIIWAMEQCRWGDPAPAIPILEKKLLDYRLDLPKR
jgi:hypothetical protein